MQDEISAPDPDEYDLSLTEAAALVSWSEATLVKWATVGQSDCGRLPALRTPDGLRFRTEDLVLYIAPGLNLAKMPLTPERIEIVREVAATVRRLSGRAAEEDRHVDPR